MNNVKVNLDNDFELLTQAELEELAFSRRLITIADTRGDYQGKITSSTYSHKYGYKFIQRNNHVEDGKIIREIISEHSGIFPAGTPKPELGAYVKMYKNKQEDTYFFVGGGLTSNHFKDSLFPESFFKLDEILRQESLPLKVSSQ
jgi:hypothetical protein